MSSPIKRGVRLFANTHPDLLFEVKKLAALQVPNGEKGSVQDVVNYVMSAVSKDHSLANELYWKGKEIFYSNVPTEPSDESDTNSY